MEQQIQLTALTERDPMNDAGTTIPFHCDCGSRGKEVQTRIQGRNERSEPGGCYVDTISSFRSSVVRYAFPRMHRSFESQAQVVYSSVGWEWASIHVRRFTATFDLGEMGREPQRETGA